MADILPANEKDLGLLTQLSEQLKQGVINTKHLEAFVAGRNPFEATNSIDTEGAITILGESKVITAEQVCTAFNYGTPAIEIPIRYSEETLRECAVLNKLKLTDWRLVYGLPLSLRKQREIIGTDTGHQPCFKALDWWMKEEEDSWAKSQPEEGYQLINFIEQFSYLDWEEQEIRIANMGDNYQRADERIFTQSLISIQKNQDETHFQRISHWGRMMDSTQSSIFVKYLSTEGLNLSLMDKLIRCNISTVCVARKPDF